MFGPRKTLSFISLATIVALSLGTTFASAESDFARGEKVSRKCTACHNFEVKKNKLGPHLVDLLGRKAGSIEGYKFSKALRESGLVWDEFTLDGYLANPRKFVKGGKMIFTGLRKEQDRTAIISYIRSHTAQP